MLSMIKLVEHEPAYVMIFMTSRCRSVRVEISWIDIWTLGLGKNLSDRLWIYL